MEFDKTIKIKTEIIDNSEDSIQNQTKIKFPESRIETKELKKETFDPLENNGCDKNVKSEFVKIEVTEEASIYDPMINLMPTKEDPLSVKPKKFKCQFCPKTFHENHLKIRHEYTHRQISRFNVCIGAFSYFDPKKKVAKMKKKEEERKCLERLKNREKETKQGEKAIEKLIGKYESEKVAENTEKLKKLKDIRDDILKVELSRRKKIEKKWKLEK